MTPLEWAHAVASHPHLSRTDAILVVGTLDEAEALTALGWPCVLAGDRLAYGNIAKAVHRGGSVQVIPGVDATEKDVVAARAKAHELAREAKISLNTTRLRVREWADMAIQNAPHLVNSYGLEELRGRHNGLVTLVAPGPSLDIDSKHLHEAKRCGIVVCGQHALGALVRADVEPDYVVCVESRDVSSHFDGVDPRFYRRLVLHLFCHPALFKVECRERFVIVGPNSHVATGLTTGLGEMLADTGGSSTTVAYQIARYMGADRIMLVGHDMACTDGRMYATGVTRDDQHVTAFDGKLVTLERKRDAMDAPDAPETIVDRVEGCEVPGMYGQTLRTTLGLDSQRTWLERAIAAFNESGGRTIHAGSGGAFIDGVRMADILYYCEPMLTRDEISTLPPLLQRRRLRLLKQAAQERRRAIQKAVQAFERGLVASPTERLMGALKDAARTVPEVVQILGATKNPPTNLDEHVDNLKAAVEIGHDLIEKYNGLCARLRTMEASW